jgi:hypothetical protein
LAAKRAGEELNIEWMKCLDIAKIVYEKLSEKTEK